MAASDALAELAARARNAEDRAVAAKNQARSDVEVQVAKARDSARRTADRLLAGTATAAAQTSRWWTDLQQDWSSHVSKVRHEVEGKKAERDNQKLRHRAEVAESDAVAAVAFAEAALEEAEYAVLDATLARMDANAAGAS
ncbi:MAG TPA: hypothetical protein VFC00_13510 [Micromonosporaceae bacterium]|nr:hypothetical protein [Micromonosporaceae bacterium]